MFFLDPTMMAAFFHSWFGMAVVIAVGILEVLGILVIRKIIHIDV
jgi:Flp pilus assembly protein TadB